MSFNFFFNNFANKLQLSYLANQYYNENSVFIINFNINNFCLF
jgi:hypothetical protein